MVAALAVGLVVRVHRHRCLLVDRCRTCGKGPQPATGWLHIPQASRCSARPATVNRTHQRCGADLAADAPHDLVNGHAVLAAQHVLDTGTATFGLYAAPPASQVFTDLARSSDRRRIHVSEG